MIKFKKGDLISLAQQGKYDIILHGVNCHCKMSDGIALQLAKAFPEIENADLKTKPLDQNKLGTFVPVNVSSNNHTFIIANCYTQFHYAGYDLEQHDLFDYTAFKTILKNISTIYTKEKIAMPLIGTGHAGGDMGKIIEIIKQELKYNNVDVIVYSEYQQPQDLKSITNKLKCWLA